MPKHVSKDYHNYTVKLGTHDNNNYDEFETTVTALDADRAVKFAVKYWSIKEWELLSVIKGDYVKVAP